MGDIFNIKITGADTGGAYSVVEVDVSPGHGAPPHTHHREDEGFYILEGELELTVGDRVIQAKAGAFLHGPRDIRHWYNNVSSAPARLLFLFFPAGFEQFFAEVGPPVTDPSGPAPALDLEKILEVAPRYGLELHLSPS